MFTFPKYTSAVSRSGSRATTRIGVLLGSGALLLGALLTGLTPPNVSDSVTAPPHAAAPLAPEVAQRITTNLARLPLSFVPAAGNADFTARGDGYGIALTPTGLTLGLRGADAAVALRFLDTNAHARGTGEATLPGTVNYFVGNDPTLWRTGLPTFAAVRYRDLYAGIDVLHHGTAAGELEHDLVVSPGADPQQIAFRIEGTRTQDLDPSGDLLLGTTAGELRLRRPVIYQEDGSGRTLVAGGYRLLDGARVGFWLGSYDPALALVIDPVLLYSTYFGGAGTDAVMAIAIDASGNAYVTGNTSSDIPTASPYQLLRKGNIDAFVSKLNPAGSALVYSTYLGGALDDLGNSIAVDASGNAYVAGQTSSTDFPTASPYQSAHAGGGVDAFVTKLNPAGSALVYSTYLGGSGGDFGYAIAVDPSGNAYVTGTTFSTTFPTVGAYQAANGGGYDAFVTKLDPAGSAVYSTYLGGAGDEFGNAIAVASGNAYVAGKTSSTNLPTASPYQAANGGGTNDAFVTKLNPAGSALVYSTYLGGSGADSGNAIAVDASGNAYVAGETGSANFPTASPYQAANGGGSVDAFVTKLNPAGSAVYSTYLGGNSPDMAHAIAIDASGSAYVAGQTQSTNFPTLSPYQAANSGGYDVFVTKLNPAGSALGYSTYIGGPGDDIGYGIAVDASGQAYVGGAAGPTFPTAAPFQGTYGNFQDGFVLMLAAAPAPTVTAISPTSGALAGGTAVTITGTGFITGATITIGGTAATGVVFVSSTSLTATTPAHVAGLVAVVVTNPDTQTGSGNLFTYQAGPTVTAISPTSGPLAGGTAVTITGTGFVTGATITIGGTPATSVGFVSATSLTATAPAHAAGAVNVVVTNPDTQTGTGASLFTYLAAPTVSAISPTSGPTAGGTAVTITGASFISGATVTIGGTAATGVGFVSATSLLATTPAHAAGLSDVVVTNPDAQIGTGPNLFTFLAAPTVSAISPTGGPLGGGTAVTITGAAFVSGATVTIGGTAATGVAFVSATSLTATAPPHVVGAVNVVVTNPDTQTGTGTGLFTYAAAPTVSGISPTNGPIAGGTAVTITGTGFVNGAAVTIGGTSATGVAFVNATSLTATTPAHAAGTVNVVVTNPDSQVGTGTNLFSYLPAPTVSAISPTSGPAAGGTAVTITGTGFIAGATVTIGGTSATSVGFASATSLLATTPAHAVGLANVVVTNPDSQTGTGTSLFTFTGAPTVGAISPMGGALAGGTAVTITGTGFVSGATVTLGGTSATGVVFVSATSLTATTPAHAPGVVNVVVTNPDTQTATGASLFTYSAAPTVSATAPSGGPIAGGTAVTISGTGYSSGATVTIGGTAATGVVFVSSTSLTATTPAHAAGPVNVVVTNPDSQTGTGMSAFTYGGAPTVSAISPSGGAPAGGTALIITGTGFSATPSVTLGGAPATGVSFVSATTLTATAPAHAAGLVNVVVTNPDTQAGTGTSLFTYAAAPTVSAISPTSGPAGGGSSVTITGTGFVSGATVTIGGSAATTVAFVSATSLTATAPAHGAGLVDVVVTNPDTQTGTGTSLFTYVAAPSVTGISPTSGPPAGGTAVTITGTGFVSGATITIGGSAATTVAFVSATSLTATTPAHAAGTVNVVVTNPDTQSGTGTSLFTYVATVTVTGVSPTSGPAAGGTTVTITGSGFVAGATVMIGGTAASGVGFASSTSLIALTPAHIAGLVNVVVTNPDTQTGTGSSLFTYTAAPMLSAISPTNGAVAGGTTVTISGASFVSGATVTIGGTAATGVVFVSATSLTATTPAHVPGVVDVIVTNPDGQSVTGTNLFTYQAAPTVSAISPTAGLTGGGTAATITGTAFASGATVTIGGTSATGVVFVSATTLNVTTPAHAAGTATVTVTNPNTQSGNCTNCYTYGTLPPAPTVSGITANSGPTAGSVVIVSGTGFIVGATVSFGGTAATGIMVVSATTITATSPAHAAGSVDVVVINPDTQTGSCVSCFTYVDPAPAPAPVSVPGPSGSPSCAAVSNGTITQTCIVRGSHARIELRVGTRVFRADGTPFQGALLAPDGSPLPLGAGIAAAITVRAQDGTPFTLAQPALLTIDLPIGLLPRDVQPIALNGAARPTYFSKANSPIATSSGEVVGVGMLIGGSGQYGLAIIPEVAAVPVAALGTTRRSGLHSRIVGESAWPTLEPNQIATLIVQVQNTGDIPWVRGVPTRELRLGATAPHDNTRDADSGFLEYPLDGLLNRYTRQTEAVVAPGGVATMAFQVRAPASGITRRIDMRPVIDGVAWLEDDGLYLIVVSLRAGLAPLLVP